MENFLSKEQLWTRKPKQATVTRETVEIVTGRTPICGSEPTMVFKTTMLRCFKSAQPRGAFLSPFTPWVPPPEGGSNLR